jgi:hypothetical protein
MKDPEGGEEQWIEHTIWLNDLETWECLVPHGALLYAADGFQIMIEATGDKWLGFDDYGQLAVDWIFLYGARRER